MIGFLLIFCCCVFFPLLLYLWLVRFSPAFTLFCTVVHLFAFWCTLHTHTCAGHIEQSKENYLSLNWFQHLYYKRSDHPCVRVFVSLCWFGEFATRPVICCTLIVYISCFISFRAPKKNNEINLIGFVNKGRRMLKQLQPQNDLRLFQSRHFSSRRFRLCEAERAINESYEIGMKSHSVKLLAKLNIKPKIVGRNHQDAILTIVIRERGALVKYKHVHMAVAERCRFRFRLILQRKYHQYKSTRTGNDTKDTHSRNFIKYYEFPTDRLISCIFNIMNMFGTLLYALGVLSMEYYICFSAFVCLSFMLPFQSNILKDSRSPYGVHVGCAHTRTVVGFVSSTQLAHRILPIPKWFRQTIFNHRVYEKSEKKDSV